MKDANTSYAWLPLSNALVNMLRSQYISFGMVSFRTFCSVIFCAVCHIFRHLILRCFRQGAACQRCTESRNVVEIIVSFLLSGSGKRSSYIDKTVIELK